MDPGYFSTCKNRVICNVKCWVTAALGRHAWVPEWSLVVTSPWCWRSDFSVISCLPHHLNEPFNFTLASWSWLYSEIICNCFLNTGKINSCWIKTAKWTTQIGREKSHYPGSKSQKFNAWFKKHFMRAKLWASAVTRASLENRTADICCYSLEPSGVIYKGQMAAARAAGLAEGRCTNLVRLSAEQVALEWLSVRCWWLNIKYLLLSDVYKLYKHCINQ